MFVAATVERYLRGTDRREPTVTLQVPGEDQVDGLFFAIVSNTSPWTYFGRRPVVVSPHASFDTALDVAGMHRLGPGAVAHIAAGMLAGRGVPARTAVHRHDVTRFALTARRPLPVQVDGEYVGERDRLDLEAIPAALRVLDPAGRGRPAM